MPIDTTKQYGSVSPIFGFPMTTSLSDVLDRSYFNENLDQSVYAVSPDDTNALAGPVKQVELGTGGDLAVVDEAGNVHVLHNLAAGVIHQLPFRIVQIKATGTTAENITAFG